MYEIKQEKLPFHRFRQNIEDEARLFYDKGIENAFYYKVEPILNGKIRLLRYDIYLKNSPYSKPTVSFLVDKDDNIIDYNCMYCDTRGTYYLCKHFLAFSKMIINSKEKIDIDKINEIFALKEENERKKELEKKKKEQKEKTKSLLEIIKKNEIIPLSEKVKIECYLKITDKVELSLKVGNDKLYVIQNIGLFLKAIEDKEEIKYGKKFSFVHLLENFDDFSQKIIMYLASFSTFEFSKSVILNKAKIESLFKLYTNKFINISFDNDYQMYHVLDEEKELELYLNEKYDLSVRNAEHFIEGYSLSYIVYDSCIYPTRKLDPSLCELVKFVEKEKDFSFEFTKDSFEKELYPRFYNNIELAPEIEKDFHMVKYDIEAYFDINDMGLSLNTKYLRDGEEVEEDDMNAISFQLVKYKSFISNFGFGENNLIEDQNKIATFLKSDLTELKKVCDIYLSESIRRTNVKPLSRISSYMTYNTGIFSLFLEKSEYSDDELEKIIRSLKKKVRFVKLNTNTIIEVSDEQAEKLLNTVEEFNLDIKHLSTPHELPLYQSLKFAGNGVNVIDYKLDESLNALIKDIINFKDLDLEIPESLKSVMRPYQIDAFKWMKTLAKYHFCGILADDMGLGKTLEVISVLLDDETEAPTLIVCPKSLCYNWKNEFSIWANDQMEVINVIGSIPEREEIIKKIDKNKKVVYISSYDSLRNDVDLYRDITFRYMILDEAQSIKNHSTMKAKSVKQIRSINRFVLTGTPIENSVVDLWSIFDFLMSDYLGSYVSFKNKYEKAVVEGLGNDVINHLIKKISPFVLRRTKKEVLKDLPDKVETIQIATMEKDQKMLYDAQLKKAKDVMKDSGASKIQILALLTRLRQVCVDPKLFVENYTGQSAKMDLVMELLDDYIGSGHKVIIFSQFTSAFALLEERFVEAKYKYFELTGKTSAEERVKMANDFNNPENDVNVFLVSLKAGGTGLNLIGADIVIHLDPWWNYAVENQATDRAHRIGQKNVVQVIKVICENSIEQKVIELQRIKKDVAEKIILSDEDNYNNITISDLKYLLD